MVIKMDVIIAGFPGLFINVPYREHEPIQHLRDRVSNILDGSILGHYNDKCELYMDGIFIEDYTKSIYDYKLFGKTITYKGCVSLFSNARTPPPKISLIKQSYEQQQQSTRVSEKVTEQENKTKVLSVEKEVQKVDISESITTNEESILETPKRRRRRPSALPLSPEGSKKQKLGSSTTLSSNISDSLSSSFLTLKVVIAEGEHVIVDLKKTATVKDLKEKLSYMAGVEPYENGLLPVCDQFLFFYGSVLESKDLISKYTDIQDGEIQLAVKIPKNYDPDKRQKISTGPNPVKLFVRKLTGKTLPIFIDVTTESIEELKRMIEYYEGTPLDQQRLIFAGKQLEHKRLLRDYHIRKGDKIHLVLRLLGGGGMLTMFADVSDSEGIRRFTYSDDAPKGRTVINGTNIEVECKCTPTYRVIYNKGMGLYELGNSFTQCPNCHSTNVKAITVGFASCQYRIHGVKEDGTEFKSDWKKVSDEDAYQRYDPSDQVLWKRLGIESKDIDEETEGPCCTICLENIKDITTLPCSHQFHTSCISRWKLTCPNCRASHL
ncbi:hypothetical protein INT45_004855 [Circinella minor]|uniref:Uncharacterized protein n=1 Tax=Circinella minor TaxID=1195481 RepID=A0A8H7RYZ4_9FUNG|nr:hypothetical protein INT45_004855 [Circinella minor]